MLGAVGPFVVVVVRVYSSPNLLTHSSFCFVFHKTSYSINYYLATLDVSTCLPLSLLPSSPPNLLPDRIPFFH